MMNLIKRKYWFDRFMESGLKFQEVRGTPDRVNAWAKSMSLISDEFLDCEIKEYDGKQ